MTEAHLRPLKQECHLGHLPPPGYLRGMMQVPAGVMEALAAPALSAAWLSPEGGGEP